MRGGFGPPSPMNTIGDRIQLQFTDDPYTDLVAGDLGTVNHIDDMGTVFAKWDNGSSLGLVPGIDEWVGA
jgi:hypothetical protein